jgi:hypothetical protein
MRVLNAKPAKAAADSFSELIHFLEWAPGYTHVT